LTQDETSGCYAIIMHNVRTYRSAGVVAVVRGKRKAEATVKEYEASQSSSDHHEGWRYFIEKSELSPGTDPTEATHLRQADLEKRELKETPESEAPVRPSSNTHK